ncbi:MAG: hypothetical protein JSV22_07540 [Bacteroidales bacterium]|nr:MAG: hypothetical protein JSV22_07540 [Bacteroidales bacterium]
MLNKAKICISLLLVLIFAGSCKKVKEYFHDPETEPVSQVIKTSAAIGYSVSVAMSVMSGEQPPHVISTGDCSNFPCTFLVYINVNQDNPLLFGDGAVGEIVVAGLRPDEDVAIMTIVFTNVNIRTQSFTLLSVHTIPVIKEEDRIMVVFSEMDINFDPDSDALLNLDLSQNEIDSEFSRLERERPEDLYVAVEQNAYFINIDQKNTFDYFSDDLYAITGGGQLIEVIGASGGIIQQAMLNVEIESGCHRNPVDGYALIKNTSAEERRFPELGTAVFDFHDRCDGMADISVATGVYLRSNGKSVPLDLDN